jgi:hypothetical protein
MARGRPIRVPGFPESEVRAIIGRVYAEDPDAIPLVVERVLRRRRPDLIAAISEGREWKGRAALYERIRKARLSQMGGERRTPSNRFTRARVLLGVRGRPDLATKYDVSQLREIAIRFEHEGADRDRNTDELFVASILFEVGLIPGTVVDPVEEQKRTTTRRIDEPWA